MRNTMNVSVLAACAALVLGVSSAHALDTREVTVERFEGLVEVPEHVGQVLANPNRIAPERSGAVRWEVYRGFERHGAFRTAPGYLKHPDNLFTELAYFAFDSDEPLGGDQLQARIRDQVGPLREEVRFVVVGHADEAGTQAYNMALSIRRAQAVADVLVKAGVPGERIEVIGRGKLDPVSFTDQSRNRRAELIVRGNEKVKAAYKRMISGSGPFTCRACLPQQRTRTDVNSGGRTPIGQEANRQPSAPVSVAPARDAGPTATMKALQKLRDNSAEVRKPDQVQSSYRADQRPMSASPAVPAPTDQALDSILNPAPVVIPKPTE